MKISGSIKIRKPKEEVVRYFADPQYLGEYQEGFVRKEHVSGEPQTPGAVSTLFYEGNGRKMELTETITTNNLPDTFEAFYHHKHMDNTMKCSFREIDANTTDYLYEFEYTRINWVMPKLMAILFPGVYRKQGEKWMNNFKLFVEKQ